MPRSLILVAAFLAGAIPATARAQLTLRDALDRADRHAYANRIAGAEADARAGQALAAYRGILPTVRVEAGAMGTTDPINAFGTTLRQRAITPADFDPARLNHPDAVRNRMAGLVVEQPLFNADAWTGRRAAGAARDAMRASADWTREETRLAVVRAFYGTTLASELRGTLEAALRAANAHAARAQALADTGLVTQSDALLARVRAGEVEARHLEAVTDADHARRGLAVLLGARDLAGTPPTGLPASDAIRAIAAADTAPLGAGTVRADVRAAGAALDAARADALRARSLYLPRLNGFARYDWNDPDGFFANDRSWTVGVMATWTPFAGASEISEVRTAAGKAEAAKARHEAATAQAALAIDRSRDRLVVAFAQLDIAERGVEQAEEAHRIVARKYDGGIATISELLEAAAAETQARLAHSMARYQLILAAAERRVALGGNAETLTALDASLPDSPDAR
jgi:outer membrane protein TolC